MAVVFVLFNRYLATEVEGRDTNVHIFFMLFVFEYTVHSKRYMYIVDFSLRRYNAPVATHLTYGIECLF